MIRSIVYPMILSSLGCAVFDKPSDPVQIRNCIIRVVDHMCWIDKASGQGISLDKLDGYFAQPSQDMTEIMNLLNHCELK